ncbi:hypothetical protein GLW03_11325 [Halobacillus halophilus]|uniref:hypothetical protein n=1 Tax=Halobacillus halophilus TaxID=1570 RepID=UPI00136D4113|nr:hypothetical protein [Halobacillus halophilus]MYL30414.1 hypothetical protein [Halobacillus halophilus]
MKTAFDHIQKNHRIYIGTEHSGRVSFHVGNLIKNNGDLEELLTLQAGNLNAPNLSIAGLLFGKMYSVLTMGLFESIVRYGLVLDGHPDHYGIETKEKNAMNYILPENRVHAVKDVSEAYVKEQIHTFIVHHLQPLFQTAAHVSKCKAAHMRSIVSHNLHQRMCALEKEGVDPEELEKVFRWFTSNELFQEGERNPLFFNFRWYTSEDGKETYVRRHCCMKYMLHNADKRKCCATCPLISDKERRDRI